MEGMLIRTRFSENCDRNFDRGRDMPCFLWRCEHPRGMGAFGEAHAMSEIGEMYRLATQQETSEDWQALASLLAEAITATWGERYVPTGFMHGPAVPEDIAIYV